MVELKKVFNIRISTQRCHSTSSSGKDDGTNPASERTASTDGASGTESVPISNPVHARHVALVAAQASEEMALQSQVVDIFREECIPKFSETELVVGKILGSGSFNDVYEVRGLSLESDHQEGDSGLYGNHHSGSWSTDESTNTASLRYPRPANAEFESNWFSGYNRNQKVQRDFLARHCIRESTGEARYAIKHLAPETLADDAAFETGAEDLATEARFLAALDHPNIIKLRGFSEGGVQGFAKGSARGYFLVLDRLYQTLEDRLQTWYKEEAHYRRWRRLLARTTSVIKAPQRVIRPFRRSSIEMGTHRPKDAFADRLTVAFDIAGALAYLHSHGIIYRDLKPDNIGFDCRGDVKIFDFGLAKELNQNDAINDGSVFRLTGNTGSLRYMAPEVAQSHPYNLSADVYSFAILLWEICTLEKPFEEMDISMHSKLVVYGTTRPPMRNAKNKTKYTSTCLWSEGLRTLIESGWQIDFSQRPSMDSFYRRLQRDVVVIRDGDDSGLNHRRRRSTHVMPNSMTSDHIPRRRPITP